MARGREIPRVLVSKSPIGWLLRKLLGRRLNAMNIPQFACEGLNFGYYYDHSPVIHYDDEQPPSYDMGTATPSSVPGCRAPHFWQFSIRPNGERLRAVDVFGRRLFLFDERSFASQHPNYTYCCTSTSASVLQAQLLRCQTRSAHRMAWKHTPGKSGYAPRHAGWCEQRVYSKLKSGHLVSDVVCQCFWNFHLGKVFAGKSF